MRNVEADIDLRSVPTMPVIIVGKIIECETQHLNEDALNTLRS